MTERDPATGRFITECTACTASDTDPKHSVQINRQVARFHFDCHAPAGCPDCVVALAEHGEARGSELVASLAAAREG